ncbi:MAG: hypothetical protein SOR89_06870, partial [Ndongobacter sp.]|nr:hypothetical protein [Ndongobacter sp.]
MKKRKNYWMIGSLCAAGVLAGTVCSHAVWADSAHDALAEIPTVYSETEGTSLEESLLLLHSEEEQKSEMAQSSGAPSPSDGEDASESGTFDGSNAPESDEQTASEANTANEADSQKSQDTEESEGLSQEGQETQTSEGAPLTNAPSALAVFARAANTGWKYVNGELYYYDAAGKMVTGWQWIDGKRYVFRDNGVLYRGWNTISGIPHYLDIEDGHAWTGVRRIDGKIYLLNHNGAVQKVSGWRTGDGEIYYFDAATHEGASGWRWIDARRYHFSDEGRLSRGWTTVSWMPH